MGANKLIGSRTTPYPHHPPPGRQKTTSINTSTLPAIGWLLMAPAKHMKMKRTRPGLWQIKYGINGSHAFISDHLPLLIILKLE